MLAQMKHLLRQLLRKSTYLRHEPINKVSIIILTLVDIFVLFNVFSGLDSIAQWPLNPTETFPCFAAYERYQTSPQKGTFALNAATLEGLLEGFNLPSSEIKRLLLGSIQTFIRYRLDLTSTLPKRSLLTQDRSTFDKMLSTIMRVKGFTRFEYAKHQVQ